MNFGFYSKHDQKQRRISNRRAILLSLNFYYCVLPQLFLLITEHTETLKGQALKKEMAAGQYSCLENPIDRAAWRVTVVGVSKSQT